MELTGRSEEQRDDLVEQAAREIQLRGLTVPAVLFLQASRPYRQLGSAAMVFFDRRCGGSSAANCRSPARSSPTISASSS